MNQEGWDEGARQDKVAWKDVKRFAPEAGKVLVRWRDCMEKASVEAIVRALNQHQVQYLIVGGLAVVAHGYVRFTADVDLLLGVDGQNLRRAVDALRALDFRPRAPVPFEQ